MGGGRGSASAMLALAALLLLAGCSAGTPARLYLLTPIRIDGAVHDPNGIAIGVGPVVIPQ